MHKITIYAHETNVIYLLHRHLDARLSSKNVLMAVSTDSPVGISCVPVTKLTKRRNETNVKLVIYKTKGHFLFLICFREKYKQIRERKNGVTIENVAAVKVMITFSSFSSSFWSLKFDFEIISWNMSKSFEILKC